MQKNNRSTIVWIVIGAVVLVVAVAFLALGG